MSGIWPVQALCVRRAPVNGRKVVVRYLEVLFFTTYVGKSSEKWCGVRACLMLSP